MSPDEWRRFVPGVPVEEQTGPAVFDTNRVVWCPLDQTGHGRDSSDRLDAQAARLLARAGFSIAIVRATWPTLQVVLEDAQEAEPARRLLRLAKQIGFERAEAMVGRSKIPCPIK